MEFPTYLSSPARIPASEARLNPQDGQDLSLGILLDEANAISNTQYAAGGVRSSPLPATYTPSSYDQLRALLSTCFSTEVNAGRGFGLPNSGSPFNTSSPGSELSSSYSSSPPSSITSPVGEELSLSFASPDLPFHDLSMNDQDPLQACQYPFDLSFLANDQPYQTPPKQPPFQPVALPELCIPNMSDITVQSVGINNGGAFPGSNSFPTMPPFSETTALGLYYPSTPQSPEIPPLSTQADASMFSTLPPATSSLPPTETRKVRAVAPTARTKRVRSGRMPVHAVAAAATAVAASAVIGTVKENVLKCSICGFRQSTPRKADLDRHMMTHQDAKLTRYVCCGVTTAHPAAADLGPGHSVRLYKGHEFFGGCGKSFARMDALQRHSGKSGCACGTAKDHQIWRKLYF